MNSLSVLIIGRDLRPQIRFFLNTQDFIKGEFKLYPEFETENNYFPISFHKKNIDFNELYSRAEAEHGPAWDQIFKITHGRYWQEYDYYHKTAKIMAHDSYLNQPELQRVLNNPETARIYSSYSDVFDLFLKPRSEFINHVLYRSLMPEIIINIPAWFCVKNKKEPINRLDQLNKEYRNFRRTLDRLSGNTRITRMNLIFEYEEQNHK